MNGISRGMNLPPAVRNSVFQLLRQSLSKHPYLGDLMQEINNWMTMKDDYEVDKKGVRSEAWYYLDEHAKIDLNAWWSLHFPDKCLSTLSALLHSIPLTSAANERTWSMRGYVHSKTRNRLYIFWFKLL